MKLSNENSCKRSLAELIHPLARSKLTQSLAVIAALSAIGLPVQARHGDPVDRACSTSAHRVSNACQFDQADNYWLIRSNCAQLADADARADCHNQAAVELKESLKFCKAQLRARKDLCKQVGEQGYDKTDFWKPENFINPMEIGVSVPANPYFALVEGSKSYGTEEDGNTVTITSETKLINGVTCLIVQDLAYEEGKVVEDTDDWYAQDIDGNVWYCGEIAQNFEVFEGDEPADPELVDTDGSWKAFRDFGQPGFLIKAAPVVGEVYRQEMQIEEAEDVAEVVDNVADGMRDGDECNEDGEEIVAYIDSVCDSDCLITKEFSPIEPGIAEHKYYAPGVGLILEIKIEDASDPADVGSCTVPFGVIEGEED